MKLSNPTARNFARWSFVLLSFFLFFSPPISHADYLSARISASEEFKLWWNGPIRAHPSVPLRIRMPYYEVKNQPVIWAMTGAPAGMTIDSATGLITWPTPSATGAPFTVIVSITRPSCNSTRYPGCVLTLSRTFTLNVNTTDFLFFSTSGTDNAGCGAYASPCAKLSYIIANKFPATDGKTIYGFGGTYVDGYADGTNGRFYGKVFPADDYTMVAAIPGQTVLFNFNQAQGLCMGGSTGQGEYVVLADLSGRNAGSCGNFKLGAPNEIGVDLIGYDSLWDGNNNVEGFGWAGGGEKVFYRTVSYATHYTAGNANNVGNYFVYNNTAGARNWAIDFKSWDSEACIKIKHTNGADAKIIFHQGECIGERMGLIGVDGDSSIRYTVFKGQTGQHLGLFSSDNGDNTGGMLFENNEFLPVSTTSVIFGIAGGFGNATQESFVHNLVYNPHGPCSGGRSDGGGARKAIAIWEDDEKSVAELYPWLSNENLLYFSSGLNSCFNLGKTSGAVNVFNLTSWQALTAGGAVRDTTVATANPALLDVANGYIDILSTSPAATSCGGGTEYCGVVKPDRNDFGQIGVTSASAHLNWYPLTNGGGGGGTGGGGTGGGGGGVAPLQVIRGTRIRR